MKLPPMGLPPMRLPVCAAPMFLCSGPDLVIAACLSGIMGSFPTPNARPIEQLDEWMKRITQTLAAARAANPRAIVGPWAANLITHSSNTRLPEDLAMVAKYKPPYVITALGSPKPALEVVHAYGGKVIADVINLPLARKAVAAGVDGLACVSAGAGGHTGYITPFAFVSAIREFFDGLIIIGGGIADGWGIAGAIAAGADLVYMGTRFLPTEECMAEPAYKQMIVDCTVDDLIVSAGVTGTPASWLKPSLKNAGFDPDNMPEKPPKMYDSNAVKPKSWKETFAAGQGLGSIKAIEPVAVVVDRLEAEYKQATARFGGLKYGT